jgi:hypothetical protein
VRYTGSLSHDPNLSLLEDSKYYTLKDTVNVVELAPDIFRYLRKLDDINENDIRNSLDPERNLSAIMKSGEGSGKSGSFFFFSGDNRFIIKTMTD